MKEVYGLRGGYAKDDEVRNDELGLTKSEVECREEECSEK